MALMCYGSTADDKISTGSIDFANDVEMIIDLADTFEIERARLRSIFAKHLRPGTWEEELLQFHDAPETIFHPAGPLLFKIHHGCAVADVHGDGHAVLKADLEAKKIARLYVLAKMHERDEAQVADDIFLVENVPVEIPIEPSRRPCHFEDPFAVYVFSALLEYSTRNVSQSLVAFLRRIGGCGRVIVLMAPSERDSTAKPLHLYELLDRPWRAADDIDAWVTDVGNTIQSRTGGELVLKGSRDDARLESVKDPMCVVFSWAAPDRFHAVKQCAESVCLRFGSHPRYAFMTTHTNSLLLSLFSERARANIESMSCPLLAAVQRHIDTTTMPVVEGGGDALAIVMAAEIVDEHFLAWATEHREIGAAVLRTLWSVVLDRHFSDAQTCAFLGDEYSKLREISQSLGQVGNHPVVHLVRAPLPSRDFAARDTALSTDLDNIIARFPQPADHVLLFHGTTLACADAIIRGAPHMVESHRPADFGTAFYTTCHFSYALHCAAEVSRAGRLGATDAAVICFSVDPATLEEHRERFEDGDWAPAVIFGHKMMRTNAAVIRRLLAADIAHGAIVDNYGDMGLRNRNIPPRPLHDPRDPTRLITQDAFRQTPASMDLIETCGIVLFRFET